MPFSTQRGLTLLEMLVVFLLVALLSTLLIQGIGYFLGQYQAVQRFQGRLNTGLSTYTWFSESVEAMIPYAQSAKKFRGDAHSFTGTSMQALASESGMPTQISWTLSEDDNGDVLFQYQEEGQEIWNIPVFADADVFEYADTGLSWHKSWPPVNNSLDLVPRMVRLLDRQQEVVWLTNVVLYPRPVPDYRVPR